MSDLSSTSIRFNANSGYRPDFVTAFYNHHEGHALPALFYSPWDNALIVTADGGGDNVHYSHRHFIEGRLTSLYGGEGADPPQRDDVPLSRRRPGTGAFGSRRRSRDLCLHARAQAWAEPRGLRGDRAKVLEEVMLRSFRTLLKKNPARNLGI